LNFPRLGTETGQVMFPAIFDAALTQVTILGALVVDGGAKIIHQNQQFRWIRF
jgi:hypothetical protein